MAIKWVFNPFTGSLDATNASSGGSSPLTTKGDLYTYAAADARLPVGADGQVLKADSSEITGLNWGDLAGGSDEKVKYDGSDPTAGYLADKIVSGTGVVLGEGTGADENKLKISGGYTAGAGLILSVASFSLNTNVNINKITGLTTNGFITTSGGDGTLGVDTNTYLTSLNGAVLVDQTTPQTIINGVPLFEETRIIDEEHQLVDKYYVDQAVTAIGDRYYMIDTASGTEDYKLTQITSSADPEESDAHADVVDDEYLRGWISPVAGAPSKLIAGVYDWVFWAQQTGGNGKKDLRLYWTLVEYKADTSEVVIATSSDSNLVGTSKAKHDMFLTLSEDYEIASDSYVVGKVYASVSGSGGDPSITLYYEGDSDSHWEIPTNTEVLKDTFVPYTGATNNTDLGSYDLTTTGDITGGNLSGSNTGDQTTIVGITGTKAQFNTALSDGDFAYSGGAFHDGFSDFVVNEHLDWTISQAPTVIHADNYTNTTYTAGDFNHDDLANIPANDHIDHTTITLTAGTGLTGGGTIAANRTFNVDVGIADDKIVQIDSATVADDEYARFTANGLESRSVAEVADDIEASIDHGNLAGLSDDDHTQYLLAAGTRNLSADWTITHSIIIDSDTEGVTLGDDQDCDITWDNTNGAANISTGVIIGGTGTSEFNDAVKFKDEVYGPKSYIIASDNIMTELNAGYLFFGYAVDATSTLGLTFPRKMTLTGVSVVLNWSAQTTAGSITFNIKKNDSTQTTITITVSGTGIKTGSNTFAMDTYTWNPTTDFLQVEAMFNGGTDGTATDVLVNCEFTPTS